jgi:DNA-binding MarR family transcriptional regulator
LQFISKKRAELFDPLLHQSVRSKLISSLIANEELPFRALKEILGVTDGNLSSHLKKLEDGGYVKIEKSFEGKRPRTTIHITDEGSDAFKKYIDELRAFVEEN